MNKIRHRIMLVRVDIQQLLVFSIEQMGRMTVKPGTEQINQRSDDGANMNLKRILGGGWLLAWAMPVQAGMTTYDLNDVARLRLQEISFFLVLLLVAGLGVRFLWNHVARGLPVLPRLSLGRALCLTGLLSLMMLLVLSMISGAREFMTPEAWRRQGSAYQINDAASEPWRRQNLEALRTALHDYARAHDHRFPPHDFVPEIPDKMWRSPDRQGTRYIYVAGRTSTDSAQLIACEPVNFGDDRFVLQADGAIRKMKSADILTALATEARP